MNAPIYSHDEIVENCFAAADECLVYAVQFANYVSVGDLTGMRRAQILAEGAAVRMNIYRQMLEPYHRRPAAIAEAAE